MSLRTVALAAAFVVAWSSGFVGAVLGTGPGGATTTTLLAWRFLAAAVLLLLVNAYRSERRSGPGARPRVRARDVVAQAGVGLLVQFGYLYGVVRAVDLGVSPGTAALLAALQPLVAAAVARPLFGERVSGRQWAGLAAGLGGVLLVVGGDLAAGPSATPAWAYALPLAAVVVLVAGTALDRRVAPAAGPAPLDLLETLTVQVVVSAGAFVALAAATGTLTPPARPAFWVAVAWGIGLSTIGAYGAYWLALRHFGATRLNVLLYLTPPATAVWAALMFGTPITLTAVAGMLVGLAAVGVVSAGRGPSAAARVPRSARPADRCQVARRRA